MEFQKDNTFFLGRIKSFKYAVLGAFKLIATEHSIMAQFAISGIAILLGLYFEISRTDWMFQILAIGLVLSVEGLNTAAEKIADFIHPEFHEKIGFIKDVAAGAVFFAAMTSLIIGLFIYVPHIGNFINQHFN